MGIKHDGLALILAWGIVLPLQAAEMPERWPETQVLISQARQKDPLVGDKLLEWLHQSPDHALAPYWGYLLSHYPGLDASPHLNHQPALQAYYQWWKVAHAPPNVCTHSVGHFARVAHHMPDEPVIQDYQAYASRLPCWSGLNESERLVWAQLFARQKLYSFTQKLLSAPQSAQARLLLAQALQNQERYSASSQVLLGLSKIPTPTSELLHIKKQALLALGENQHRLGQDSAAIRWWQWISPHDQEFYPEVLWQRAMLELRRDRDTKSLQWMQWLAKHYPQHPRTAEALWFMLRGAIRQQQDTQIIQLAQPLLTHAALEPETQSAARYWLAKALAKQGQTNVAQSHWQTLAQGPLNDYYTHMANCQLQEQNCYQLTSPALQHRIPDFPLEAPSPLLEWVMNQPDTTLMGALLPFQGLTHTERELMTSWAYLKQGNYFRSIRTIWKQKTRDTRVLSLMYPLHYFNEVAQNAQRFQLPHGLIAGLIWQESMYKADIRSHSGAIGLMQLMPGTAQGVAHQLKKSKFSIYQLVQPAVNIEMGSFYLRQQLNRFQNKPFLALAAYNGGPHSVDRWLRQFGHLEPDAFIEQITYNETRRYVKQVLAHYWVYQSLYAR